MLKSALKSFKKLENKPKLKKGSDTKTLKNKFNIIRKNLNNCKRNQSTKIKLNKAKHDLKKINKRYLNNNQIITEEQLKEIENFNYNIKMYKAIKFLKINNYINKAPPPTPYNNQQLQKREINRRCCLDPQDENCQYINLRQITENSRHRSVICF